MAGKGFNEASTTQAAIVDRLAQPDIGFEFTAGKDLERELISPMLEQDVVEALIRLNPEIAAKPERVDEVLPKLRAIFYTVADEGLVAANERMMSWLRGLEAVEFMDEDQPTPIRLIDFDDPAANQLRVSTEVRFQAGTYKCRFDIVLWINGFPLVVGETKTPVKANVSWLNAAKDIHDVYEPGAAAFFVPNVLSFASEGKDLYYGPIGLPAEHWLPWGKTDEQPQPSGIARTLRAVELLLRPELILDILRNYSLYADSRIGTGVQRIKIVPRYPQVEGVEAIVERVKDTERKQGLLQHHQGSGKTFVMAFAAGKLRRELPGVTVLVVLDRLDLDEQAMGEFQSVGVEHLRSALTKNQLREMLASNQRGVIVTTIYRFEEAGLLSDRSDIAVLVDEAHRTQEGTLGNDMRAAIPNATYIGLTGTPITTKDRDTFERFGHPDDPNWVMNTYSAERSMADGATLEIRVEAPPVHLEIDKAALDEAFDEMTAEAGLTDEEKEVLARKATRVATLLKAPERIKTVCDFIVNHYCARVRPLGLKAQVVCYDRELCVLYQEQIQQLLDQRGDGDGDESTVVMTCQKDDPAGWHEYDRDRAEEGKVKARFRDAHDPLRILIVTAKLLTGFDAPIEGVMYLDKPLKEHTLFQALARTNRPWTNPDTTQEKTHGLVVDLVGLGPEIADAMKLPRKEGTREPLSTDELIDELAAGIEQALERFAGIDLEDFGFGALQAAQEALKDDEERDAFAREFLKVHALWELLWPEPELKPMRAHYRWLARVYQSVQPAMTSDALLWHRLGAKTLQIVSEHITAVRVEGDAVETVTLDEETLKALRELGVEHLPLIDEDSGEGEGEGEESTHVPAVDDPPDAEEIIKTIEARIEARLNSDPKNKIYRSLAERLDQLRQTRIETAQDSIEFLKRLLEVARDTVRADREAREEAEAEAGEAGVAAATTNGGAHASLLPEERIGALTQIFREYKPDATPEIIERVVLEIDAVVTAARFSNWQVTREGVRTVKGEIRSALHKFGLDPTGELFERAYAYVAEHY